MSLLKSNYGKETNIRESRKIPIFIPFTDDGTIEGNGDINVDGSTSTKEFYLSPPSNLEYSVLGLAVRVTDGGGGSPAYDDYGNVNGPLANGISFFLVQGGVETQLSPVIKRNIDWLQFGPKISIVEFSNSIRFLTYTLDISNLSTSIVLEGNHNDKLGCRINDDLTGLISHEMSIQGFSRITSF